MLRRAIGRVWGLGILAHVGALVLLLAALAPHVRLDVPFTPDEGAYGLQVRALEAGSWTYAYPARRYDPQEKYFPIANSVHGRRGWFPYVRHPLYPWLLRATAGVFGDGVGLYVLSMAGTVGVALAAWLLAIQVGVGSSRLAFWIAALGPSLFNGFVLWAHSLSAALGGLLIVAVLRAGQVGRARAQVLAVAAIAMVGAMLRSESLLFAGAVGAVVLWRSVRRRSLAVAGSGVAALVGAGLAAVIDAAWRHRIVGEPLAESVRRSGGSLVDLLEGARAILIGGQFSDRRGGMLAALALCSLLVGVFWLRRGSGALRGVAVLAVAAAAGLWLVRMQLAPRDPITGILLAWPAVTVGLALLRRQVMSEHVPELLAVVGVFTGVVVLSQYAEGGGLEWGGRFLSPVHAIVAVVAAGSMVRWSRDHQASLRGVGALCVGAVLVVPAAVGIVALRETREAASGPISQVGRHRAAVVISMQPHLPRAAWREEELVWMVATTPLAVRDALKGLARARVPSVSVYALGPVPLEGLGYSVISRDGSPTGWHLLLLERPTGR